MVNFIVFCIFTIKEPFKIVDAYMVLFYRNEKNILRLLKKVVANKVLLQKFNFPQIFAFLIRGNIPFFAKIA